MKDHYIRLDYILPSIYIYIHIVSQHIVLVTILPHMDTFINYTNVCTYVHIYIERDVYIYVYIYEFDDGQGSCSFSISQECMWVYPCSCYTFFLSLELNVCQYWYNQRTFELATNTAAEKAASGCQRFAELCAPSCIHIYIYIYIRRSRHVVTLPSTYPPVKRV